MAATGGADASASDAAPQLYAEGVYTAAAANRASQIADWAAFASEDAGESSKEGGDEEEDAECFTELIYASHRSVAVAPGVLVCCSEGWLAAGPVFLRMSLTENRIPNCWHSPAILAQCSYTRRRKVS